MSDNYSLAALYLVFDFHFLTNLKSFTLRDGKTQERLLRESDLSLDKALQI